MLVLKCNYWICEQTFLFNIIRIYCKFIISEVLAVPASKRIIITVSQNLLAEVDDIREVESKNRSEIVREAISFYLRERKRNLMREQMKKGYLEMAEINLSIASEHIGLEDEALADCLDELLE
ncbi:MAG: ribbon-helix-helix protein, CopG family [Syntrophomonadaceae bacterium]|nr:ribbon-helix-helix protein, CopG family [Syntrophomonadaceae bacterium]